MACTIDATRATKLGAGGIIFTDGRGAGKARSAIGNMQMAIPRDPMQLLPETKNTQVVMHGQDCRSYEKNHSTTVCCLSDGHGELRGGASYAFYACLIAPSLVLAEMHDILSLTEAKDETGLGLLMDNLLKMLDYHLREELVYTAGGGGGATFTINIKYMHPRRAGVVCSLTSNIGDSPAFQIFNVRGQGRTLIETTRGYNADNIDGFRQYAQECADSNLPIPEVIVSRWNLLGNFQAPWVSDESGRPKPIQVYQTSATDDGVVTVKIHPDMERFYKNSPPWFKSYFKFGGVQSHRDRAANLAAQARGEYTPINFGCTVRNGTVQTLSSFGDIDSRKILGEAPSSADTEMRPNRDWSHVLSTHTTLRQITRPTVEFIMSDGVSDTMTDRDLVKCVDDVGTHSGILAQAVWEKMMTTARTLNDGTGTGKDKLFPMKDGQILWDDCSMWTQVIIPPRLKKSRGKGGRRERR